MNHQTRSDLHATCGEHQIIVTCLLDIELLSNPLLFQVGSCAFLMCMSQNKTCHQCLAWEANSKGSDEFVCEGLVKKVHKDHAVGKAKTLNLGMLAYQKQT